MPPPNTPRNLSADLTHLMGLDYRNTVGLIAPPSSPESNYVRSRRGTHESQFLSLNHQLATASVNLPDGLDYRALDYVGDVDENLMCSVCHAPFVDPVDTECNHTFCRECICQALSHKELCPMDRHPLSAQAPLLRAHRIVTNQLDALLVKCICCEAPIPRAMLQNHVERYCSGALVKCPSKTCTEFVKKHLSDKGCLHYAVTCPYCEEEHQEVAMDTHRESLCKEREKECQHCSKRILRCKEAEHIKECPDVMTPCKWREYGCGYESKRKELPTHVEECSLKSMGLVVDKLKEEITNLHAGVNLLSQKNELQARRITFLEGGVRDWNRPVDYSEMPNQPVVNLPEGMNANPLDATNEYLLSLIEAQDSRTHQLSARMNELEAKSTVMLFNETLPIKTEMAEMRSTQGIINMHVRWLMNFRRQENQKRFVGGGSGSNSGSDGGAASSDMSGSRRLSDSMPRDILTRL